MLMPLKFKLDRRSLEIMFSSFVASTMNYGIEVWGGSFDSHLLKLEQIIVDGMRLISGATAKSNIANLYEETSWKSFSTRRDNAACIMMFKMKNNMVPNYLAELLPLENKQLTVHNLRNKRNLKMPLIKTEVLKRSFIPTAVTLWNKLSFEVREANTLSIFRSKLKNMFKIPNVLYYYGKRWPSIMHARLRIGCSKLNYDLCFHLHIPDIMPDCSCGEHYENARHFFMTCPNYNDLRVVMRGKVLSVTAFDFDTLMCGSSELNLRLNMLVFDAVHEYILRSNRFA